MAELLSKTPTDEEFEQTLKQGGIALDSLDGSVPLWEDGELEELPQGESVPLLEEHTDTPNLPDRSERGHQARHAGEYHLSDEEIEGLGEGLESGELLGAVEMNSLIDTAYEVVALSRREAEGAALSDEERAALHENNDALAARFKAAEEAGVDETVLKYVAAYVDKALLGAPRQRPSAAPAEVLLPADHEELVEAGRKIAGPDATSPASLGDPGVEHFLAEDEKPTQAQEAVVSGAAPETPSRSEPAPTPEAAPAAPASDDIESEGIDDVAVSYEPVKATESVANRQEVQAEGTVPFEERLDHYMEYVERNKRFWTENRKAVKEVHGTRFWQDRWEKFKTKFKDPDRRRKLIIAGSAGLVAAGTMAGIAGSADHIQAPTEAPGEQPVAAGEALAGMHNEAVQQAREAQLPPEVAGINTADIGPAGPSPAEIPRDVFSVKPGEGPLQMVNELGYGNDKWFKIADEMYKEFGPAQAGQGRARVSEPVLYKAGNDVRFDHQGEVPQQFRQELLAKLRALK